MFAIVRLSSANVPPRDWISESNRIWTNIYLAGKPESERARGESKAPQSNTTIHHALFVAAHLPSFLSSLPSEQIPLSSVSPSFIRILPNEWFTTSRPCCLKAGKPSAFSAYFEYKKAQTSSWIAKERNTIYLKLFNGEGADLWWGENLISLFESRP